MGVLAITHIALVGLAAPAESDFTVDLSVFFNTSWLTIISLSLKMVFLILSSVFLWLIFDSLKNTDWKSLQKAEQYI